MNDGRMTEENVRKARGQESGMVSNSLPPQGGAWWPRVPAGGRKGKSMPRKFSGLLPHGTAR